MRHIRLLVAGVIIVAVGTGTRPANAEDTTTTFTVTAGALSISVPASADLGSGSPGTTISTADNFGAVTVTDARGANPSAWTATVSSTVFEGGAGVPAIPASAVTYTPGTATTTGDGTFTPSTVTLSGTGQPVYTHASGTGSNTAAWSPDLAVAIPGTATATTYSGVVTHLVSGA